MPEPAEFDPNNIPRHVAIIMDGNGRWAKSRRLPRIAGHKVGVQSVKEIVRASTELGVSFLTLYAFSTENWKRPAMEVNALMALLKSYLKSELADLQKNNVKLRCIGQIEKLPSGPRKALDRAISETANNNGLTLNLALSYGSRTEIVMAASLLAKKCLDGQLKPEDISEELIAAHLYTAELPDPDLLIRTGGEYRLSNFLLWQISYAEFYVTETMWPDFRKPELVKAISSYQHRQRRFGMTGEQVEKGKK